MMSISVAQKQRAAVWSAVARLSGDTALDIPGLRNVLGRLEIQSSVDACALPPHSIGALDLVIRGRAH